MTADQVHWSLADWLAYQEASHPQVIDLGLSRMQLMAERLSLLRTSAVTITVAGTNGKGSSTAMLSAIYSEADYKVGWYSSPHLLDYRERIRINGEMVTEELLVAAFQTIARHAQDLTLTYFEWGTLAALLIFKSVGCDVQVLEVGLGGRLDAVNVIDADLALITAIDIDHEAWLGNTREQVGFEKAGIMRSQQLVVCSDSNVPNSILERASALSAHLCLLGRDFNYQRLDRYWSWCKQGHCIDLPFPTLRGQFQLQNAAGVISVVMQLHKLLPVSSDEMMTGLQNVQLIGRMQRLDKAGVVWHVDVAHNPQSIQALTEFWAEQNLNVELVFSALADKDVSAMVQALSPWVTKWHVAVLDHPRAASREQLQVALAGQTHVCWYASIADACEAVQQSHHDQPWVSGSFVTVEVALKWLLA